jgi:hypothetical protein
MPRSHSLASLEHHHPPQANARASGVRRPTQSCHSVSCARSARRRENRDCRSHRSREVAGPRLGALAPGRNQTFGPTSFRGQSSRLDTARSRLLAQASSRRARVPKPSSGVHACHIRTRPRWGEARRRNPGRSNPSQPCSKCESRRGDYPLSDRWPIRCPYQAAECVEFALNIKILFGKSRRTRSALTCAAMRSCSEKQRA